MGTMARSAVIQQKTIAIPHVAAGTNSPSHHQRATKAQRDFLKCEQFQPEHKATKHHVEVAINSLHRIQVAYIPISPRQQSCPAAADTPGWMRWSPEDGEGGLRRVLLPRPLVRRKATIKSTEAMRYSSLKKQYKRYKQNADSL